MTTLLRPSGEDRPQGDEQMEIRREVLYLRVSTLDQHPETQRHDLEQLASQRALEIIETYEDRITGASASRPGLDRLMSDARRGKFNVVLVWACDRLTRSVMLIRQSIRPKRRSSRRLQPNPKRQKLLKEGAHVRFVR